MNPRWFVAMPAIAGFVSLILAAAVLEALVRAGFVSPYVLPPPSEVIAALPRVFVEHDVFGRSLITLREILAASGLVIIVGIPLGFLLFEVSLLRRSYETWIAAFAAAPIVLAYPLFFVLFGRGSLTIILLAMLGGLPPTVLKTVEGLDKVKKVLINVGRNLQLSKRQILFKIMFPAAIPTIFSGLKVGLIFALVSVVGVEYLVSFGGLGALVNELSEMFDPPAIFAVIAIVILISVLFFFVVERIEAWLQTHS